MSKAEFERHFYTKVLNFIKLENHDEVMKQMYEMDKTNLTMKITASFDLNNFSVTQSHIYLISKIFDKLIQNCLKL